ncbi:MAG: HDIG domain-containing protein [Candidatus Omnitrophica bacterium]|nr:HDIG domain-containing protein [Candidatus Omnitrophota bacterium]
MKNINVPKLLDTFFIVLIGAAVGCVFYLYRINVAVLAFFSFVFIYLIAFRHKKEINYLKLGVISSFSLGLIITVKVLSLNIYLHPLLLLAFLTILLFDDIEISFVFLVFTSFLYVFILGLPYEYMIIFAVSSLACMFLARNSRRRVQIIKAGIISSLIQLGVTYLVFTYRLSWHNYYLIGIYSLANGLASAFLLMGILPGFEWLFGVVSNISLLELFNHPLLRKMILLAPGTYHHSLVVANLSEAAAEAVGANALLARVGAYFHDIGKISKSEYFSENQMLLTYRDKHKKLSPAMSKLIIINHVKEGVELARKYRLPPRIIDFIQQHHGTTLVYYFYQRAKEKTPQEVKSEEEYRYPGPKPQTREIGIVHLADTVEASCRSISEPSPGRIREVVKESIAKRLLDGQLDETALTLNDLHIISEVFIRIINATFHARIEYPRSHGKENIYSR